MVLDYLGMNLVAQRQIVQDQKAHENFNSWIVLVTLVQAFEYITKNRVTHKSH